jgi:hypothetical protein
VKTRQFWQAAALWALAVANAAAVADEVGAAIAAAERAVQEAAARHALWTSAEEALRRARAAQEAGDAQAARRWAGTASEQARLGLAQKHYPLTR